MNSLMNGPVRRLLHTSGDRKLLRVAEEIQQPGGEER
jgi:hypothetical protein